MENQTKCHIHVIKLINNQRQANMCNFFSALIVVPQTRRKAKDSSLSTLSRVLALQQISIFSCFLGYRWTTFREILVRLRLLNILTMKVFNPPKDIR